MGNGLDIYTIIFLVLAVVIFFRLRSVLGERTGHEKPPLDRRREEQTENGEDNVVPLPGHARPVPQPMPAETDLRLFAREGTHLFTSLEKLMEKELSFEPGQFIGNAKSAYEMIVAAYARGDKKTLSELLAKDVYEGFAAAIDERAERDETLVTDFIGFDTAKFHAIDFEGKSVLVTIRFESNIITYTKNGEGRIVEGDPEDVVNVIDMWTFSRELGAADPVWYLVSTEYEKA